MATIRLAPDFKEFLRLLRSAKIRYLLVGGYAVGHYGHPRATGDLDIWFAIDPANAAALVQVLRDFGFDVPEILMPPGGAFVCLKVFKADEIDVDIINLGCVSAHVALVKIHSINIGQELNPHRRNAHPDDPPRLLEKRDT